MKPETIKDLRGLEEKATTGPWNTNHDYAYSDGLRVFGDEGDVNVASRLFVEDADLIAAMRNALLGLLDAAENPIRQERLNKINTDCLRGLINRSAWMMEQLRVLADENVTVNQWWQEEGQTCTRLADDNTRLDGQNCRLEMTIERLQAEAAVYEKLRLAVGEYQCCDADVEICPRCLALFAFAKPSMAPVCKGHQEKLTKAENAMWDALHACGASTAGAAMLDRQRRMVAVVELTKKDFDAYTHNNCCKPADCAQCDEDDCGYRATGIALAELDG